MSLEDLYQDKILELSRFSRTVEQLQHYKNSSTSKNPVCGDTISLRLDYDNDFKVIDYGHEVRGCVICEASAGLLSKYIIGKSLKEVKIINQNVLQWLNSEISLPNISELETFTPVKEFKNRHKCVTLSFDALVEVCKNL